MTNGACAACGGAVTVDRVTFRQTCPHCNAPLHACIQCAHYAPGKPNDCNEPNSEPIRDKDAANRCDWYRFGGGGKAKTLSKADAEALLKQLFKK